MNKLSVLLLALIASLCLVCASVVELKKVPANVELFGNVYTKMIGNIPIYSYMGAQYYGPVTVGGQGFMAIYDTGSSNVWLCSATNPATCGAHPMYNHTISKTYHEIVPAEEFKIQYGSGPVSGFVSEDIVSVGDVNVDMKFAEITDASGLGAAWMIGKFDGIVGLGFDSISVNKLPTFMDQAKLAGTPGVFAFQLGVTDDAPGSLQIGGYDKTKFAGDLVYVPLAENNYWLVRSQSITAGSLVIDTKVSIVDSGTSLLAGPSADVAKLAAAFGASANPFNKNQYFIGCDSQLPELKFTLGNNQDFTLAPKDYIINSGADLCILAIMGMDAEAPSPDDPNVRVPLWILGDVFMKKYYTVFDLDNNRLGFGVSSLYK